MDFDFIYIKRSAIKLWIALRAYILHLFFFTFIDFYDYIRVVSEHFSKTLGGIFQKPGWTPNPGWDFPKAWVEFSTTLSRVFCFFPRPTRFNNDNTKL